MFSRDNFLFVVVFLLFFFSLQDRVSLCHFVACPETSSYRPDWPRNHRDPLASASRELKLKVYATTAQLLLFFKTGFFCAALEPVLQLTLQTRLASNSQRSACLCSRVLGLKACTTTTELKRLFRYIDCCQTLQRPEYDIQDVFNNISLFMTVRHICSWQHYLLHRRQW